MAFKMKKAPVKPVRSLSKPYGRTIYFEGSVSSLLAQLDGIPGNATINSAHMTDEDYYGNCSTCSGSNEFHVSWKGAETNEEFKTRVAAYKVELEAYNVWYDKHKDKVASRSIADKEKAEAKKKKIEERKHKDALRALEEIESRIARDKKTVDKLRKVLDDNTSKSQSTS